MMEAAAAVESFARDYPLVMIVIVTMAIFGLRLLGVSKRGITWIGGAILVSGAVLISRSVQ